MRIAAVVMAAGAGERFNAGEGGTAKLLAPFRGKPLYAWALDALPEELLSAVIVVSGRGEILSDARARGFATVENNSSALGVSLTIRLGVERAEALGMDAALFMVADQPLITRDTVAGILRAGMARPGMLIVPVNGGKSGNPVLFPGKYFAELKALMLDRGGKAVVRAHAESVFEYAVADARELSDADTADALAALE